MLAAYTIQPNSIDSMTTIFNQYVISLACQTSKTYNKDKDTDLKDAKETVKEMTLKTQ